MRDPKTGRFPKGNGAGWGGSAKGASTSRLVASDDPDAQAAAYSDAVRALSHDPKHAEAKQPLRELALSVYVEVCQDKAHSHRLYAAEKMLARIDGQPTQNTDITSKGERVGYVIEAPPEAPDAETWTQQHKAH